MKIPTLQTPRLTLRPWQEADCSTLLSILEEPDIFSYFPPSPPPTLDRAKRYITHHLEHWQKYGYGHWAVTIQGDNTPVGWCGLEYLPELNETEVAYLLSARVRSRGYATEAAQAAIDYGLRTCNLPAIIGLVHAENTASVQVLKKCGLVFSDKLTLWNMDMDRYRISNTDDERE